MTTWRAFAALAVWLASLPAIGAQEDVYGYMGKRYGVDPTLLKAISWHESRWHPWTVNIAGEGFYLRSKQEALDVVARTYKNPWLLVLKLKSGEQERHLLSSEQLALKMARADTRVRTYRLLRVRPGRFDVGLMQIHWEAHRRDVPSVERLFDPDYNVAYGAKYLADLIRRHGTPEAIGYYHSPTRSRQVNYRSNVMHWYDVLSRIPAAKAAFGQADVAAR